MSGAGSMIKYAGVFFLSFFATTYAFADPVILLCNGSLSHPPEPKGSIGPSSVIIDLENKIIKTPLGEFTISRIDADSVVFGQPTNSGSVGGNIDRISGSMSIFWLTAAQKEASKKGPFKYEMFASLECAPAKKMF